MINVNYIILIKQLMQLLYYDFAKIKHIFGFSLIHFYLFVIYIYLF